MSTNMAHIVGKILHKDASLLSLPCDTSETPEEWLEREQREWGYAGRVPDGSRMAHGDLNDVAAGKRWPLKFPARLQTKGMTHGCSVAWAKRGGLILLEFAERKAAEMGIDVERSDRSA